jgi:hypothetical protein
MSLITGENRIWRPLLAAFSVVILLVGSFLLVAGVAGADNTKPAQLPPKGGATPTTVPPGGSCIKAWYVVGGSPQVGRGNFLGVDAVSAADVWAVGYQFTQQGLAPLIEHWDGTSWSRVSVPSSIALGELSAVEALSATDVWAVGSYNVGSASLTLVLHWDGSAWAQVASPNPGASVNYLQAISAIAANDIWAVGVYYVGADLGRTLTLHWDGTAWAYVSSPNVEPNSNILYGVAAISANDVWAVGSYFNTSTNLSEQLLSMHWNGAAWSIVPTPTVNDGGTLYGVDAVSTSDVWAVGYSLVGLTGRNTLALHWNGSSWSVVPTPNFADEQLRGVTALSSTQVWAVGYFGDGPSTRIIRWDGTAWTQMSSPNPAGSYSHSLRSITAVSADDLWAVGDYSGLNSPKLPLILHYTDNFIDVHPSDFYYEPVRQLYCMNVVAGYADGTFRPNNNTTRGQFSKIVVLAERWFDIAPPTPTFNDVPNTHPFFYFIETAHTRGVMSGYADRTFRPSNGITRGQLCKVIVLAEGWAIDTAGGPHFSDVPASHPFYQYIETAYNHGIISGYADGTFRPGTYATRGQISKIVFTAITQP